MRRRGDSAIVGPLTDPQTNSAYNEYPAVMFKKRAGGGHLDACFQNPDTYQTANSEIFVAKDCLGRSFRALVFCDVEAQSRLTRTEASSVQS